MTVKDLKELIENVPDDSEVRVSMPEGAGSVRVEDALVTLNANRVYLKPAVTLKQDKANEA